MGLPRQIPGQPWWDLGLLGSGTEGLAPTETIKHAIEDSDGLLSAMPVQCGDTMSWQKMGSLQLLLIEVHMRCVGVVQLPRNRSDLV